MTKNNVFKIVVAGEDFAAVMHAEKLSGQLAAELEPELKVSNDAWKFETLEEQRSGRAAARGAARADMIIIAASGAFELPGHIKNWIESWLPRQRKGATALVALCDHEDEDTTSQESSPVCAYLRRMAGKWGLKFLTNAKGSPRRRRGIQQLEITKALNPDYA